MRVIPDNAVPFLTQLRSAYFNLYSPSATRDRMLITDKYLHRSSARDPDFVQGMLANVMGDKTKIRNLELPLCLEQFASAHAYYAGMFCTGFPMIGFTGDRNAEDVALMLQSLAIRDQQRFGWVAEFMLSFADLLRHDIFIMELEWASKTTAKLAKVGGNTVASAVMHSGNRFKRIDPYNFYYDHTPALRKLHEDGAFAGYVEQYSYIGVRKLLDSIGRRSAVSEFAVLKNFSTALSSTPSERFYYEPEVNPLQSRVRDKGDWTAFFGVGAKSRGEGSGVYEVSTLYVRIIPEEYGISLASGGGTPTIFKLLFINDVLVFARPLQNAHGMLSIVACPGNDSGVWPQNNSFVENVMDLQDAASSMLNGSLASMRRSVGDRALYDPLRVKSSDVNSANPVAKIPVTNNSYKNDLESAYRQIPYVDTVTAATQQNLGFVLRVAQSANGLNPASQGSFVKGNKTQQEFDTVMSRSDARLLNGALALESNAIIPLKQMAEMNYLQYATAEDVFNPVAKQTISISPAQMLEYEPAITGTDGLLPASKVANTDVLVTALSVLPNIPQLATAYDVAAVYSSLLKAQGVDISQYKLAQPQQAAQPQPQQEQQQ